MPLHLIPPGKRTKRINGRSYTNPFYIVRGKIGGQLVEISTSTRDAAAAAAYKARVELDFLEQRVPSAQEDVTFSKAMEFYIKFRQPNSGDEKRIRRIASVIGEKLVREVQHADLVSAADQLYPNRSNETKNRWTIKPAAAILHYAAENNWCEWIRIRKLREAPVQTRASDAETARALLHALDDEESAATTELQRDLACKKRLLIIWLFRHYTRISDTLRLNWNDHIDLSRRTYRLLVSKTRLWREKPLNDEVFELLANDPEKEGFVFPWRTRSGVYKWLRPLVRRLGVTFTPHMARHFGGKALNASGAGLKTIMGALDHSDPQSSIRYQDADLEIVRGAINDVGRLTRQKRKENRGGSGK